jgi:energy-coupling factor transport system substrate-specific component
VLLGVASLIGVAAFCWPLVIQGHAGVNQAHAADAPWLFVAILPLLLAVILGEMAEGTLDAKAIALLGSWPPVERHCASRAPGWPASSRYSSS